MTEFAARVDAFFEEYFAREPTDATTAGNHAYDGLWPDVSMAARADRLAFIDRWRATFAGFSDAALDVDERVDRDLLLGVLESYRFNEVELREDAWSPMAWVYLIGDGFFGLDRAGVRPAGRAARRRSPRGPSDCRPSSPRPARSSSGFPGGRSTGSTRRPRSSNGRA